MLAVILIPTILFTVNARSTSNRPLSSSFYVIPLGTVGGLDENNLSAYLITTVYNNTPSSTYITLDAGTLRQGIQKAIENNALPAQTDIDNFYRERIKAFLITHGHLDHASGFILSTPNDKPGKFIIGINETINVFKNYYFQTGPWLDFGPTGLQYYDYIILDPFSKVNTPIPNTDLDVRIFRLCHICPYIGSAFLVSRRNEPSASVLFLGDTGPDDLETIPLSNNTAIFPRYLNKLWESVAPLIAANELKAIFIEVSFPSEHPDSGLFGHLTTKWVLKELNTLRSYHSLDNVKIIVTHIKPVKGARERIIEQLTVGGGGNFNFIFPEQGRAIWL